MLGEARRSSRLYPLYLCAISTGMREGELLGLRWRDIDWITGTITVQQQLYRLGKRILVGPPKNKKPRSITMTVDLADALRTLQREQHEHRTTHQDSYEDSGLVFCQPNGRPLHSHNVTQRDFKGVVTRAKLPRIRFHDLRHLHASYLFKAGVHPKVSQERMGHHSPAYTMKVYGHLLPGMQEDATRRIERLMRGADPGDSRG